jgi:hypothetical protein
MLISYALDRDVRPLLLVQRFWSLYSVSGIGRSGTDTLKVDGTVVSTQKMEFTVPIILQFDGSCDVRADTGTPGK